jgi:aldehyde:ferredoxin oxidoreductase
MGADHTAGNVAVDGHTDPQKKDGQIEASRNLQIAVASVDSLGMCVFTAGLTVDNPDCLTAMVNMINARYGVRLDNNDYANLGKYVLKTEHQFNLDAGFTNKDDRLPEFFTLERLAPHNAIWDFTGPEIDTFWNF